jgi:zinc/manganese transport system substrate-binding protein
VATFSILKDLTEELADGRWRVTALVGPDADIHSYQATPGDARSLARADLMISNGLTLEGWLPRLVGAAEFKGRSVVASRGIVPLTPAGMPGMAARAVDPHCWQDVALARRYSANIADGLAAADPDGAETYRRRLAGLDRRLAALDAWVRSEIARVPVDRRRVITNHDAFGYFARAYGVEFLAARGIDPERAPTAREFAHLVSQVRRHRVKALFIENFGNRALIDQLAQETDGFVGRPLYTDALSAPAGPAATYEAMMRHNVVALVEGMLHN